MVLLYILLILLLAFGVVRLLDLQQVVGFIQYLYALFPLEFSLLLCVVCAWFLARILPRRFKTAGDWLGLAIFSIAGLYFLVRLITELGLIT